jgi:hypothetical protein
LFIEKSDDEKLFVEPADENESLAYKIIFLIQSYYPSPIEWQAYQ